MSRYSNFGNDPPKAVWSGTFTVLGVELKCHVLDNGRRIIEADSMEAFFRAPGDPGSMLDNGELITFTEWQKGG